MGSVTQSISRREEGSHPLPARVVIRVRFVFVDSQKRKAEMWRPIRKEPRTQSLVMFDYRPRSGGSVLTVDDLAVRVDGGTGSDGGLGSRAVDLLERRSGSVAVRVVASTGEGLSAVLLVLDVLLDVLTQVTERDWKKVID